MGHTDSSGDVPPSAGSEPPDVIKQLLAKPPAAPEDALEARTPAKAAYEGGKPLKTPGAMTAVPTKPGLKVLVLDTLPIPEASREESWLAMASRRAPQIEPPPPQPAPEPEFDSEPPPEEVAQASPPGRQEPQHEPDKVVEPSPPHAQAEQRDTVPTEQARHNEPVSPSAAAPRYAQGATDKEASELAEHVSSDPGVAPAPSGKQSTPEPPKISKSLPEFGSPQAVPPKTTAGKTRNLPPGYVKRIATAACGPRAGVQRA